MGPAVASSGRGGMLFVDTGIRGHFFLTFCHCRNTINN